VRGEEIGDAPEALGHRHRPREARPLDGIARQRDDALRIRKYAFEEGVTAGGKRDQRAHRANIIEDP